MEHDAENTQDLDGRLHLLINQGTYLAGEFRGTAYRPIQTYKDPSDNSKMVLSIVKIGPPGKTEFITRPFRAISAASAPPIGLSSGVGME